MNIEVIINLAIILFVVFSVLKRVKEVSKKAQDLKGEPDGAPPAIPVSERRVEPSHVPSETPTSTEPLPKGTQRHVTSDRKSSGVPPILREFLEEFEVLPRETEKERSVEIGEEPETRSEALPHVIDVPKKKGKPALAQMVQEEETAPGITLGLGFSGNDLIRGIVMSEILGPPVALKEQDMQ